MKKLAVTILLIALGHCSTFTQSKMIDDECIIFSKVLDNQKILWRYTAWHEISENVKKQLDKMPKDLVEDFFKKNETSAKIGDAIEGIKFSDELEPIWNKYNQDKKEIRFVFVTNQFVSRVGFSKDRRFALVYYGYADEATPWGIGYIYEFVKNKSDWKEKKRIQAWVY